MGVSYLALLALLGYGVTVNAANAGNSASDNVVESLTNLKKAPPSGGYAEYEWDDDWYEDTTFHKMPCSKLP